MCVYEVAPCTVYNGIALQHDMFFSCQWVQDTAPGNVIKIESPNQFAPIGADPKELKTKFHQV
jgi:hypothetical protein